MTLHRRWGDHDVMTLHRRWGDVIFTSLACPEDWYPHNTFCYSQWKHVLWYSLEKSRRCDSDGYPQHMLSWKNEENISTFRLRKKMCFISGFFFFFFFFFYQISSFLLNTNLNWPKQILSISFCDNLHIKTKKWRNIYFQKKKKKKKKRIFWMSTVKILFDHQSQEAKVTDEQSQSIIVGNTTFYIASDGFWNLYLFRPNVQKRGRLAM